MKNQMQSLTAILVAIFCAITIAQTQNLRATNLSPLKTATEKASLKEYIKDLKDHNARDMIQKADSEVKMQARKLIRDADFSKECFIDNRYRAEADYYLDPFLANNDRGDWGKCLPHEVFSVLCEHMAAHMINNGEWEEGDGPLHDAPSEQLWPALMQKHDDYCFHLDVQFPAEVQDHINDFFKYEGIFEEDDIEEGSLFDAVFHVNAIAGKYWMNGYDHPDLTFYRGATYTFVYASDHIRLHHPIRVGTDWKVPYETGMTVNPTNVTFTVPMDAPENLIYYCDHHFGMGNDIIIPQVVESVLLEQITSLKSLTLEEKVSIKQKKRDLNPILQEKQLRREGRGNANIGTAKSILGNRGALDITFDMACVQTYNSPRVNLQMSIYCSLAFFEDSVASRLFAHPYTTSAPCSKLMKSSFPTSLDSRSRFPISFCEQDVEENTCTVHASVRPYEANGNGGTCRDYCEGHQLTCVAAHTIQDGMCRKEREVTCDSSNVYADDLLCTCGMPAEGDSIIVDTIPPDPAHPMTLSAKAMITLYEPPQICSQNFTANTVTVVGEWGGCDAFCGKAGLRCMHAGTSLDETCTQEYATTCDAHSGRLCTCGPGPNGLLESLETSVDTAACLRLQESRQSYFNDAKVLNICPPNALGSEYESLPGHTCTARVKLTDYDNLEDRTCSRYCRFHKSMECVAAAYSYSDSCYISPSRLRNDIVTCDTVIDDDAICACQLPENYIEEEAAEEAIEPSNACINMALGGDLMDYEMREICGSNITGDSSCKVMVNAFNQDTELRNCDSFCGSFEGMQCIAANTVGNSWTARRQCYEGEPVSCNDNVNDNFMMCTCGFQTASERKNALWTGPVLQPNYGSKCPAYEYNEDHIQQNERDREYSKITLSYEIDAERNDGSLRVADGKKEREEDIYRDNYNVNDIEICDGLTSTIQEGDNPLKCSFGNRLYASSPCYGKLEMNYESAEKACAARGGHLLTIDSQEEYQEIKTLYYDQRIGWGLHKANGFGFEWSSNPGVSVNLTAALPFLADDWNSPIYGCTELDLGDDKFRETTCNRVLNYICEADPSSDPDRGGDLLTDEGGFCLWYLDDPDLTLPDDESGGFRNTEIAHWLAVSDDTRSRKYFYFPEYEEVHDISIEGHEQNYVNWDDLTYEKLGRVGEEGTFLGAQYENFDFHCHMSPTNFGVSRIYLQQHMLERIYPGQFKKHCFCGYQHLGHLVSRCDCTLNGVRNNNCRTEHRPLLWEATARENGEYVRCNNCNNREL